MEAIRSSADNGNGTFLVSGSSEAWIRSMAAPELIPLPASIATSYRGGASNDTFIVTSNSQQAIILDFNDSGNDVTDLSSFELTSEDVGSLSSQLSADVLIGLAAAGGAGDTILVGTVFGSLDFIGNSDFI